jgi:hypothetical protein
MESMRFDNVSSSSSGQFISPTKRRSPSPIRTFGLSNEDYSSHDRNYRLSAQQILVQKNIAELQEAVDVACDVAIDAVIHARSEILISRVFCGNPTEVGNENNAESLSIVDDDICEDRDFIEDTEEIAAGIYQELENKEIINSSAPA